MSKLLAEHIFKPGSFPKYTYVSRKSLDIDIDYELRLKQALKISGFLTSIVGPSKMGKIVLLELRQVCLLLKSLQKLRL